MNIRPLGAELFRGDRQRDRQKYDKRNIRSSQFYRKGLKYLRSVDWI